jgi:hypothetical protein
MITLSKKAIVFTAFDRVEYLKRTLDSWAKVRMIQEYDIYFKVEPSDKVNEICEIINNFAIKIGNIVNVDVNNKVMGCATNTWFALDKSFEIYDFVILAEDDIIVSEDVCEYFNYLEEKYRDEEEISIISANTKWDTTDPSLFVKEQAFNGLVWGTWKNKWENYFKDTWDWNYSSGNGGPAGWDWNITLRVLPNNHLYCIHPLASRSQHIGVQGIHCSPDMFDLTQYKSFKENYEWTDLELTQI